MSYIESIKTALFTFPVIAFLFTIPFILSQYHKYGSIHKLRVLIVYSFILYMITVYFLVILPLPKLSEVTNKMTNMMQLVPFSFISDFIHETSFVITNPSTYLRALKEPCFYTVVFNIFMTVPFGMYLRYYFKCSLKKVAIFSFLLSLFFEITQLTGLYFIYPGPYRLFDVDDLIVNTFGGVLGYYLMGFFRKLLPSREKIDEDSYQAGEVVSGLRRITIFSLDFFLFIIITFVFCFFFRGSYTKYICFVIYYGVIPLILHGRTIGSKFLNVKFEYPNYFIFRSLFRMIFLYFYYFYLPGGSVFLFLSIVQILDFSVSQNIIFCLGYAFLFFNFYFINVVILFAKKRNFYDRLFKVKYKNIIERKLD